MALIPTGICRHCNRPLHFVVDAADWCDNLGWYFCPAPNISKHYPIDPVEGIDYSTQRYRRKGIMISYELLEDVPQMVTRVVSQSGRTNATRCGQDGRWYNQTSDVVPLDAFGPWTSVQHQSIACDVCMQVSGALIPSANGHETRACAECVKVLVLCPRCDRVADWTLSGDLWICGSAEGCGYPGVWL